MNRRDFLTGLVAASGITIAGTMPVQLLEPIPIGPLSFDTWHQAFMKAYLDMYENLFLFGVGALEYTEEFPYVRSIHPKNMTIDFPPQNQLKGLL
jgi:hypothetical protein